MFGTSGSLACAFEASSLPSSLFLLSFFLFLILNLSFLLSFSLPDPPSLLSTRRPYHKFLTVMFCFTTRPRSNDFWEIEKTREQNL